MRSPAGSHGVVLRSASSTAFRSSGSLRAESSTVHTVEGPSPLFGSCESQAAMAIAATVARRHRTDREVFSMRISFGESGFGGNGSGVRREGRLGALQQLVGVMRVVEHADGVDGREHPREHEADRKNPFTDRLHGLPPFRGNERAPGVPGSGPDRGRGVVVVCRNGAAGTNVAPLHDASTRGGAVRSRRTKRKEAARGGSTRAAPPPLPRTMCCLRLRGEHPLCHCCRARTWCHLALQPRLLELCKPATMLRACSS